jgi:hypothetical protein
MYQNWSISDWVVAHNLYFNFFREFNLFGGIRFWMELVFSWLDSLCMLSILCLVIDTPSRIWLLFTYLNDLALRIRWFKFHGYRMIRLNWLSDSLTDQVIVLSLNWTRFDHNLWALLINAGRCIHTSRYIIKSIVKVVYLFCNLVFIWLSLLRKKDYI